MESLIAKALEHGAWGLLVAVLIFFVLKLWDRYCSSQDALMTLALAWQRELQSNTAIIQNSTEAQKAETEVIRALSEANRVIASEVSELRADFKEFIRSKG